MHKSPTVLVIERDPKLRGVLEAALRDLGCRVAERLDERPVDCILLDLARPDEAGLALLHRMRRSGAQVPIIGVSSEPPGALGCGEAAAMLVRQVRSGLAEHGLN